MDKVKVFRISFQAIFTYSVVMKDGLMEENQFGCIVSGIKYKSLLPITGQRHRMLIKWQR
jgi:hypothetical protein